MTEPPVAHAIYRVCSPAPPRHVEAGTSLQPLHARLRSLVAIAVVSVSVVLATPVPAAGWAYGGSSNSPGGVAIPHVSIADIFTHTGPAPNLWLPSTTFAPVFTFLSQTGPTVGRSPATTGAQDLVAIYVIQKWDGAQWGTFSHHTVQVQIPSGQAAVVLPTLYIAPNMVRTPINGYYAVGWIFEWRVPGTTTRLGATVVGSDRSSDYSCITQSRPCHVGPFYVQVGRAYMLGGGW